MSEHAPEIAALIGIIDRLEAILERSALTEIEIEHEGTALVVRKPSAVAPVVAIAGPSPEIGRAHV